MERAANDDDRRRVEYLDAPVKSENDKKEYRVIRLQNGLTALLIADIHSNTILQDEDVQNKKIENDKSNKTDKMGGGEGNKEAASNEEYGSKSEEKMAAFSLCVEVGSFSDPLEVPGMAHFLEHMVFMGSEKYPKENEVHAFIEKHGGYRNAMTMSEQTVFFFDIQEEHFVATLDRFAQIFIKPLMKKEAIVREREAVDSEFQLLAVEESFKKMHLFSIFARKGHPPEKFTVGNLVTLQDNVNDDKLYEELQRFRERHYSAHRMNLTIQARLPLDTLEKYVTTYFADIPNNGLAPDDFTEFKGGISFDTPAFRRMYKTKLVFDGSIVNLTWVVPSLLDKYKSEPPSYLHFILTHRGKGSLFSYLRKKLWATDIFCGDYGYDYGNNSMYTILQIMVNLTNEGQKHLEEVLDAIFSFINLMKREGPQRRIYDEMSQMAENEFRFISDDKPINYVQYLSENMHRYPSCHYITGSKLYFEYDPQGIRDCIDSLVPENVNVIIFDKKFEDEQLDKIGHWESYNCKLNYADAEIPPEWIERWKTIEPLADFNLPLPNVFLTSDFSLIPIPPDVPKYPVKIHADSVSEIWYRPDPKFRLPECYIKLELISPLAFTTSKMEALTDMFVLVLQMLLNEELYPAQKAGVSYNVESVSRGIQIKITGFNKKQPLVLMTIAKYIAEYSNHATKEMFEIMKERQIRDYYNSYLKPSALAFSALSTALELVHWTYIDLHTALSDIDFEEFQHFAKFFTHHLYIQCLVQGNMTEDAVIENIRQCIETLDIKPLLANTMPRMRITQIPVGRQYCKLKNLHETDTNSVILNYYQIGIGSIQLSVLIELLMLIMQEPLFNKLRTLEQLGYAVDCNISETYGIVGYSVELSTRAGKCTTEHVDERIEEFLKTFSRTVEEMPEQEMENFKKAVIKAKRCADVDLREEFDRNWAEITIMEYTFDRLEKKIAAIKDMRVDELKKCIVDRMLNVNNLGKLSVRVVGTATEKSIENKEVSNDLKRNEDTGAMKNREKIYCYKYIIDEQETKKTQEICITDIEDYKRRLYVYPISEGINP